ncbi:5-dehydro-2-deoxygluconokinase [Alphaproteobacteria bacterium]|nr:5-dehydro-2-deoxygluconokinase [Alphaproteobacteria bacterium]MDB3973753.1 5-dehydro-2-deoxygluconokinase [Alphaproteobacteria bacterium]
MEFDKSKKILVIGRAGMDIYPEPPGTKITDVTDFSTHLGGSAANTCVALSKLGVSSDLVTCISDDAIGEYILNKLKEFKVGSRFCRKVDKVFQTQLAVVETILKNNQSILYRNNSCDLQLNKDDIDQIDFQDYSAVFISGTALSSEPSREAVFYASQKASKSNIPLIIDLDYRPYNWESDQMKSEIYQKIMSEMDIIIGNDLEFNIADNSSDGFHLTKNFIEKKPSIIIYKMGEKGSKVLTKEKEFEFGIFKVDAIKPTGAGDAFNGGFISSLYKGMSLDESVKRGSANAALVVTNVGCSSAMPDSEELEKFINQQKMEN